MGPFCLPKGQGVLPNLTKAIEIKGSGFPLRRERRRWSCAPMMTPRGRGKDDIQDAPAAVYNAIAITSWQGVSIIERLLGLNIRSEAGTHKERIYPGPSTREFFVSLSFAPVLPHSTWAGARFRTLRKGWSDWTAIMAESDNQRRGEGNGSKD